MSGFGTLLRLRLRRDRLTLACWSLGLGVLMLVSSVAIGGQFDEAARRELVALMCANPALLFLRGGPIGTGLGAMLWATLAAYLFLLAMIAGTFLGVRHTRGDEGAGRAELIGAARVARTAPALSTLAAGAVEGVLIAAVVGGAAVASGLPLEGSVLLALGMGALGVLGTAIGMLSGAAMPTGRSANGVAAAIAGLAFVLRGAADALGTPSDDLTRLEPAAITWTSPIGWATQTRGFASDGWSPQWWPLGLLTAGIVVLVATVLAVESRRELDASLIPERRGPARGIAALGTPLGLLARLQRGALIGWTIAALLIGAVVGRIAPAVSDAMTDNPVIARILTTIGGSGGIIAAMLLALGGIVAVLASAAAMQASLRLRGEESQRAELLFATPTRRVGWLLATALVGAVWAAVVLAAFAVSAGASLASTGEGHWRLVRDVALALAPVVAVYLALGLVLLGALPSTLAWLGWVLLLGLMLGGEFAPLLGDAFAWLANISPFHWIADVSGETPDWGPSWWMLGGSLAGIALATALFRARDLRPA